MFIFLCRIDYFYDNDLVIIAHIIAPIVEDIRAIMNIY